jgi:hypothetical protein
MYETYQEEDVDKPYPEKTAAPRNITNNGPPNNGVPRQTGTEDVARRPAVPDTASEKGEPKVQKILCHEGVQDSIDVPDVKVVPNVQDVPDVQDVPNVQDSIDVPDVKVVPNVQDVPDVQEPPPTTFSTPTVLKTNRPTHGRQVQDQEDRHACHHLGREGGRGHN